MTPTKNTAKNQIKALQTERAELTNRIARMEGEIETLEARVHTGHRDAGQQALAMLPNADPGAQVALHKAEEAFDAAEARVAEIDRDLNTLQAQADAAQTIATRTARVQEIDAQIADIRATIASEKAKVSQYRQEHADAAEATRKAKDAAAAALVDGGDSAGSTRVLAEHAARAEALAGAIALLDARLADGEARIGALRAEREVTQGEVDLARSHAAEAAMPAAWAAFMPYLHELLRARRRAYGYSSTQTPNLEREYRKWLEAQTEGVEE